MGAQTTEAALRRIEETLRLILVKLSEPPEKLAGKPPAR
jgi:hypothetical protein